MSTQPRETGAVIHSEAVWDPWQGQPPADERLKNAFEPFKDNPLARAVIDELLALGKKINDPTLGPDRPSPEAFEALVDQLAATPEGQFLLDDHIALGAVNLAVVRWAIDGAVGGKPVGYRAGGRGVSDKGGRKD